MGHAICGHESGMFKSPGYFNKLPKEVAGSLKDHLINYQQDYEVDSFLAKKFPKLMLKYEYNYSREISEKMRTMKDFQKGRFKGSVCQRCLAHLWRQKSYAAERDLVRRLEKLGYSAIRIPTSASGKSPYQM